MAEGPKVPHITATSLAQPLHSHSPASLSLCLRLPAASAVVCVGPPLAALEKEGQKGPPRNSGRVSQHEGQGGRKGKGREEEASGGGSLAKRAPGEEGRATCLFWELYQLCGLSMESSVQEIHRQQCSPLAPRVSREPQGHLQGQTSQTKPAFKQLDDDSSVCD